MTARQERLPKLGALSVLLAALAFILTSCGTMPRREGLALRVSGGAGMAHAKAEIDTSDGSASESTTGSAYGVRVELTRHRSGSMQKRRSWMRKEMSLFCRLQVKLLHVNYQRKIISS